VTEVTLNDLPARGARATRALRAAFPFGWSRASPKIDAQKTLPTITSEDGRNAWPWLIRREIDATPVQHSCEAVTGSWSAGLTVIAGKSRFAMSWVIL